MTPRLIVITDPMCSWCWGMAQALQVARQRLQGVVTVDLLLGGINPHGTQPIGDYGKRYLTKLWQEVEATTGAPFSYQFPSGYIHNSTLACCALEVARELEDTPPLDLLHALQQAFFVDAVDINNRPQLIEIANKYDLDRTRFTTRLSDPKILERVRFQFDSAGVFGTQALPSLVLEDPTGQRLLAGGYVDADMIVQLVNEQLANEQPSSEKLISEEI